MTEDCEEQFPGVWVRKKKKARDINRNCSSTSIDSMYSENGSEECVTPETKLADARNQNAPSNWSYSGSGYPSAFQSLTPPYQFNPYVCGHCGNPSMPHMTCVPYMVNPQQTYSIPGNHPAPAPPLPHVASQAPPKPMASQVPGTVTPPAQQGVRAPKRQPKPSGQQVPDQNISLRCPRPPPTTIPPTTPPMNPMPPINPSNPEVSPNFTNILLAYMNNAANTKTSGAPGDTSEEGKNAQTDSDKVAVDPRKYKTRLCRNWEQTGQCPYEHTCCFAHGQQELRDLAANHKLLASIGYFSNVVLLAMTNGQKPALPPHTLYQQPPLFKTPHTAEDLHACTQTVPPDVHFPYQEPLGAAFRALKKEQKEQRERRKAAAAARAQKTSNQKE